MVAGYSIDITAHLQHTPSKPRNPLFRPASCASLPPYRAFVRRKPYPPSPPAQVQLRSRVPSTSFKAKAMSKSNNHSQVPRMSRSSNNQTPSPTREVFSVRKCKSPQSRASVLPPPPAQLRPQQSNPAQSSPSPSSTLFRFRAWLPQYVRR